MKKQPSLIGGACIIAGVCVGAGMLGLPSAGAGAWTFWSLLAIIITMIIMSLSGSMLLETFKHYDWHVSFDSVTRDLLGNSINIINNLAVYFVGGILLYAYTTSSGYILQEALGIHHQLGAILFVALFSAVVWHSTRAVDRLSILLIIFMIMSFIFATFGMATQINWSQLLTTDTNQSYAPYFMMMLPVALTSFGYHHSVASMRIYYQNEHKANYAIWGGTTIALLFYTIWLISVFGNLPRNEFAPVIAKDGAVEALLIALGNAVQSNHVQQALNAFSMAAIFSSFLGVGLGVFDFLADFFNLKHNQKGRTQAWCITFLPPLILSLLFPLGFLIAIGYAGAIATIWTCIIPALLLLKSRQRHPKATGFKTPGGKTTALLVLIFGVLVAIFHILNMFHMLPNFKG